MRRHFSHCNSRRRGYAEKSHWVELFHVRLLLYDRAATATYTGAGPTILHDGAATNYTVALCSATV